jgi:ribonuclease D
VANDHTARSRPSVAYLDTNAAVAEFFDSIARTPRLAVDTEGASFHRFVDRVYLLQVSTGDRHAIIDPLRVQPPRALGRLLEDPAVEVVFHDADYDLRLLHQDFGWHPTSIFDTRIAAQLLGITAFGLAALLERHFGVRLDKRHQRADWSMRPLTRGMLDYAAQDTMHLLKLRDVLAGELERKGRAAWAHEEFTRLEGTRWDPEEPATAFLRVKGARDLSRRELAVLRELVAWRDDAARALDRATFRVLSNDVLLEVARRAPSGVEDIATIKGMPRGMLERAGAEILEAVRRGMTASEAALPKFPKPPRWARDPDFDAKVARLKAVRDKRAAELDLDPGVLCSRDRLEAVARRLPRARADLRDVPDLRAWQAEELGDAFVRALTDFRDR